MSTCKRFKNWSVWIFQYVSFCHFQEAWFFNYFIIFWEVIKIICNGFRKTVPLANQRKVPQPLQWLGGRLFGSRFFHKRRFSHYLSHSGQSKYFSHSSAFWGFTNGTYKEKLSVKEIITIIEMMLIEIMMAMLVMMTGMELVRLIIKFVSTK